MDAQAPASKASRHALSCEAWAFLGLAKSEGRKTDRGTPQSTLVRLKTLKTHSHGTEFSRGLGMEGRQVPKIESTSNSPRLAPFGEDY